MAQMGNPPGLELPRAPTESEMEVRWRGLFFGAWREGGGGRGRRLVEQDGEGGRLSASDGATVGGLCVLEGTR